jgi:hypothetical protein
VLQTQAGTQAVIENAGKLAKGEAEKLLKEKGLWPVKVIFPHAHFFQKIIAYCRMPSGTLNILIHSRP